MHFLKPKYAFWVGTLSLCIGCGPSKKLELKIKHLEQTNATLRKEQMTTQERLQELSDFVTILQDRMETLKAKESVTTKKPSPRTVKSSGYKTQKTSFFGPSDSKFSTQKKIRFTNQDLKKMGLEPATDPKKKKGHKTFKSTGQGVGLKEDLAATRAYARGIREFEEKKYVEAVKSLEAFVSRFPQHIHSDNAVYWIGESYLRGNQLKKAVSQFERVVREFPLGNKVPDALYKAGSCYLRLSQVQDAKRNFNQVIEKFPKSIAAKKAMAQLSHLNGAKPNKGKM